MILIEDILIIFFLKYKNVPVLYSPFFSFPLSNERHSGFLLPSFGSSGESGTVISTPYYFNIADNMDITLKPTSFSGRGQMIEAELRYKTENSKTEIQYFCAISIVLTVS